MSVARAKGILELLSNRNLTNAQMKTLVVDYIADAASGNPLDTSGMTNDEIGAEFVKLLRQHIIRRAGRAAGVRYDQTQTTDRQTEIDTVTGIVEEF